MPRNYTPKNDKCSKCGLNKTRAQLRLCSTCIEIDRRERHKKGKWTEDELNELGYTLRSHIKNAIYKQKEEENS